MILVYSVVQPGIFSQYYKSQYLKMTLQELLILLFILVILVIYYLVILYVPELGIYIVSIVLLRSVIGYSTLFLASNLQSAPVDKSEIEV